MAGGLLYYSYNREREKMKNLFGLETTYEECLAKATERRAIMGYFPHEIKVAAYKWYMELVEEKLEKERK